jgi:AraC-like DNA-binding protein
MVVLVEADPGTMTGVASRMISYSEVDDYDARPVIDAGRQGQAAVVGRVVKFIDRHYSEQISLRDVARAFNYSACYLTSVFSRAMGMPVTAWIIKRRIVAAQTLLAEQNRDVATTCEAVGFNDLCYFTRQFVRHVGMTPGRFRAVMNGKKLKTKADQPAVATAERGQGRCGRSRCENHIRARQFVESASCSSG